MSVESVMPSNYLILCCPLLLLSSISPRIRVFSNEHGFRKAWVHTHTHTHTHTHMHTHTHTQTSSAHPGLYLLWASVLPDLGLGLQSLLCPTAKMKAFASQVPFGGLGHEGPLLILSLRFHLPPVTTAERFHIDDHLPKYNEFQFAVLFWTF